MAFSSEQQFYALWQEDNIRATLFKLLSNKELAAVRTANTACCNLITKRLFRRTIVPFSPNTFTRPARIQALSKIGHHIEHLIFYFPHGKNTFLPPLIHPETGSEINFLYRPHTRMGSGLTRPKYGNSELGNMLTTQYPPLFHAATNVLSFIQAMRHMQNINHLTIETPGQDSSKRYRRDIVDYALISLRIGVERSTLPNLRKLTLESVHPSAFFYLRPLFSLGCTPSAGKQWKQIRKLYMSVESWDFYGTSPGVDQLKIIDDFVRGFTALEKVSFAWIGRRGPCPLALGGDPLLAPQKLPQKLFNEVTTPMSPLPATPPREQMKFRKLRFLQVCNATMNAAQVAALISAHKDTVREFDFDNVALFKGTWAEALAPLSDGSTPRNRRWSYQGTRTTGEIWEADDDTSMRREVLPQITERLTFAEDGGSPDAKHYLPSSAVQAASRRLQKEQAVDTDIHADVGGSLFCMSGIQEELAVTVPSTPIINVNHGPRHEVNILDSEYDWQHHEMELRLDTASTVATVEDVNICPVEDALMCSEDVRAARDAQESFSTNIRKKKIKKRKRDKRADELQTHHYESSSLRLKRWANKHDRQRDEPRIIEDARTVVTPVSIAPELGKEHRQPTHTVWRSPKRAAVSEHGRPPKTPDLQLPHTPHLRLPRTPEQPEPCRDEVAVARPKRRLSTDKENLSPARGTAAGGLQRNNSCSGVSTKTNGSMGSIRSLFSFRSLRGHRSTPSISEEEELDACPPTPPTVNPAVISGPLNIMAAADGTLQETSSIVLLQPTVYDPKGAAIASHDSIHEITAVQRNLEAEAHYRMLANNENLRSKALRRAKEIVLSKLNREFSGKKNDGGDSDGGAGIISADERAEILEKTPQVQFQWQVSPDDDIVVGCENAVEVARKLLMEPMAPPVSPTMNKATNAKSPYCGDTSLQHLQEARGDSIISDTRSALVPLIFSC